MSDGPLRIALVGATGLIGRTIIDACIGREDVRLSAIARHEFPLPPGARMELFVAEPDKWEQVIEAMQPTALICALGTTWKKAGEDEAAFRAVDHDLVLETARAAKAHGVQRMVAISSVGADALSKTFYLKVKGEAERDLMKVGIPRLDILRPGLLRGARRNDRRPLEAIGRMIAPLANLFLRGANRQYRGIRAETVADAALALAKRPARGRFVHDHDAILRAARSLPRLAVESR